MIALGGALAANGSDTGIILSISRTAESSVVQSEPLVPAFARGLGGVQGADGGDDIMLALEDLQGETRGRVPCYR